MELGKYSVCFLTDDDGRGGCRLLRGTKLYSFQTVQPVMGKEGFVALMSW